MIIFAIDWSPILCLSATIALRPKGLCPDGSRAISVKDENYEDWVTQNALRLRRMPLSLHRSPDLSTLRRTLLSLYACGEIKGCIRQDQQIDKSTVGLSAAWFQISATS